MTPIDRVLSRLDAVDEAGDGYVARCPAHDDSTPSLSIDEEDGRVLLHCHAGCDADDVVRAMGLDWPDLFPDDRSRSWKPWEGTEVYAYTYHDADGEPIYQVVRYEMCDSSHPAYGEKSFAQRAYRPDHDDAGARGCPDGYVWGRVKHGVDAVLYRLPKVVEAAEAGARMYVVEGEKDVQTLEKRGLTATCNPGGASKGEPGRKWTDRMTEALLGADVVCIPDADESGRALMDHVAQTVAAESGTARIVRLDDVPPKGDVTDWIERGHDVDELEALADAAEPVQPVPTTVGELVALVQETGAAADLFEHIDILGAASTAEYGRVKGDLKTATGINLNDLEAAVQEARRKQAEAEEEAKRQARRERVETRETPVIVVAGRPSSDIVDDAIETFCAHNSPPEIYRRGGEPVHVQTDTRDRVTIEPVEDGLWDDVVARSAQYVDEEYRPRDLPIRLVQRVRARAELPQLRGVTRVPLMRPDGSLLIEPGYDSSTGYIYRPHGEPIDVPLEPTAGNVADALDLVREAWTDHPYADAASAANILALPLTLLLHPYLEGASVPLCIIDATRAGSGKTLLAQIAGLMGTGRMPASMSAPTGEAEWRKQITAQLRRGERFVVVDDVTGTIDSSSLRRALTSPMWSDRLLGASEQLRLPSEAVWAATGNNLRPRGDMTRRCYLVRLDTEMVRPHRRTGFTHRQPEWTQEHRGELAAALLTMARAWAAAGRPEPTDPPTMGGFMDWVTTIGGILENAGVESFLQNLDDLEEAAHSEDDTWAGLLRAIHAWMDGRPGETFTSHDLARALERDAREHELVQDDDLRAIADHLPDDLRTQLRRGDSITTALGRMLGYREGRRYPGGWHLERVERGRDGVVWTIEREETAESSPEDADDLHAQPNGRAEEAPF